MKNNVTDGLNKVFEVGTDLVEVEKENKKVDVPDEIDNDYKYARENLYGVIEKSTDALDNLIDLAKASEHPRAFEVLSGMIKNISDVNDRLMDLNKKKKDLDKKEEIKNIANTTNNLFVGSTAELQKILKNESKIVNVTPESKPKLSR